MAPRLTTAALALLGAAAIGAVATVAATDATSAASVAGRSAVFVPGALSLAALALLAIALLLSDARPLLPGIALLGAAWLVGIPDSSAWHRLTAVAGGSLLAVAEMAYWSLDFRVAGRDRSEIHIRRAAAIAALAGVSTMLALIPELDLASIPITGLELTAMGLMAAAALIAVAASMAWRLRRAP